MGAPDVDQLVVRHDADRVDPARADVAVGGQRRLLDHALPRGEQQVLVVSELTHRHHRGQPVICAELDQVDDRLAASRAAALRDLVDLEPVDPAAGGKEEDVVVGRSCEQVLDPVFLLGRHAGDATTAASLAPVRIHRDPLDVSLVRDRDHHILFGDQVLHREVDDLAGDLGAAVVAVLFSQLVQFRLDDGHPQLLRREDGLELLYQRAHLFELGLQLLDLEAGEPRQTHVEDGIRLALAELVAAAQFL